MMKNKKGEVNAPFLYNVCRFEHQRAQNILFLCLEKSKKQAYPFCDFNSISAFGLS